MRPRPQVSRERFHTFEEALAYEVPKLVETYTQRSRPDNRQGMRGRACFRRRGGLRAGSAPLTLSVVRLLSLVRFSLLRAVGIASVRCADEPSPAAVTGTYVMNRGRAADTPWIRPRGE